MRDFTKSMFSFSWAMSLFGLQQTLNLLKPSEAAKAFDNITEATEGEFDDLLKATFRTGNNLQRGLIDLMLGVLTGQAFNPSRLMNVGSDVIRQSTDVVQQGIKMTSGVAQQSAGTVNQSAQGATYDSQRAASGWGPMLGSGVATAPSQSQRAEKQYAAEPDISPDYPYKPHYIEVFGSKMHYIDEGSGETILFLHGNPTWSYLWRNVIPHLTPLGRCIAPDLIGYGMSDKPHIEYRWFDHVKYLEGFIERMGLKNITLVLHDQGSGLGFHYAMRHENNVRGIAFFEAIIRPYAWNEFSTPEFREIFRKFRSGGVGGEGWKLIVEQNFFIEQLLPQAAGRPLTEREMNYYREPFKDPKSRVPIWRFPRETPIGGEPKDVWNAVSEYSRRLQKSKLPKLMLYATPGALLTQENVDWSKQNIENLQSVYLGPGSHFLQESSPHRIGKEVANWHSKLPPTKRR
jgi:haloalkane dehalogenase